MGKKMYMGVDGVARKVKKAYIGVDGVTRKIKKAWIGVDGVARLCFSGGEVKRIDSISQGTTRGRYAAGASIRDYAIFAGGEQDTYSKVVSAFDSSLTRFLPKQLTYKSCRVASASIGNNYALFVGGYKSLNSGGSYEVVNDGCVYDNALTKSSLSLPYNIGHGMSGAMVGGYALFAGGGGRTFDVGYNTVTAYNSSLTKSKLTPMNEKKLDMASGSIGDYALFAGGQGVANSSDKIPSYSSVTAYDSSLTKTVPASLSSVTVFPSGANAGEYLLITGGRTGRGGRYLSFVDAYDKSLTRHSVASLSMARGGIEGGNVGNCALFLGGYSSSGSSYTAADGYDESLTRFVPENPTIPLSGTNGATIDRYTLFAGYSDVEVYTLD